MDRLNYCISKLDYKVMHLNLFENHFSFIKNFSKYAKKYTCDICKRIFKEIWNLKRHTKKCSTEIQEIYIGGKYKNNNTIFEDLESIANIIVPAEHRYYEYFSCFDMEALQEPIRKEVCGRELCFKHVPATA